MRRRAPSDGRARRNAALVLSTEAKGGAESPLHAHNRQVKKSNLISFIKIGN